ncbi:MAG: hypothetical protein U0572_04010 [Phycisphaerales bacterium]
MDARTPNKHEDFDDIPIEGEAPPASALLIGADAELEFAVRHTASRCGVDLQTAAAGDEARSAILERRFDVVLLADRSPGGASFLSLVARLAPTTKSLVLSATVSVKSVVEAMQRGAIDYVSLPLLDDDFGRRLVAAIERSREERRREERVVRLKGICKKLSDARTQFEEQARSFEADLREMQASPPEPVEDAAVAAEYRSLLRQELDLENLLRVGVEYLVGKTGPTNAAVFLPSSDGDWSLGAYVNCDCSRSTAQPMLDRLASDLCPELARQDELMRFEDTADFVDSLGLGDTSLGKCEMVAWPCIANGDCLAIFTLYRDKSKGFADSLAAVIDALRVVFAEQVATVLRIHHRSTGGWPAEADDRDEDEWEDRKAA